MRKGNIVTIVLLLLFGVIVFFGMSGASVDIYRMRPWYEQVNDNLGLDLKGGGYAVYQADRGDMAADEFEGRFLTTMSVLRARLDNRGFTEANVVAQGSDRIRVEIPGETQSANEVFEMLRKQAVLEFKDAAGKLWITGDLVDSAAAVINSQTGQPVVQLAFNPEGARLFGELTTQAYNDYTAIDIFVDGFKVSSATVDRESGPIFGGNAIITGSFTQQAAEDLAVQIASGALPLMLHEIEALSISAALGENALRTSLFAGLIGIGILFLFMLVYYRLPGLLAVIALLVYGFTILFLLAVIGVQLTLPGIAGLILGIGMAVDGNVIIFERFKEELSTGKTLRAALNSGFSKALRTIIDSNITTVIAAGVIAIFGIGTVKGFGYTLIISILTSMFTALVVTRALLRLVIALKIKNPKLYTIRKPAEASASKGGE